MFFLFFSLFYTLSTDPHLLGRLKVIFLNYKSSHL